MFMAQFASIPNRVMQAIEHANLDVQSLLMTGNRTLLYAYPHHGTVFSVTATLPSGTGAPT